VIGLQAARPEESGLDFRRALVLTDRPLLEMRWSLSYVR